MDKQLRERLKGAYNALEDRPLEPDDAFYVPFRQRSPDDPVADLGAAIAFAQSESVHLVSGQRGNGKSTELRRLRRQLQDDEDADVYLLDMRDYMNLTTPVEVTDFLIALLGAWSEAIAASRPCSPATPSGSSCRCCTWSTPSRRTCLHWPRAWGRASAPSPGVDPGLCTAVPVRPREPQQRPARTTARRPRRAHLQPAGHRRTRPGDHPAPGSGREHRRRGAAHFKPLFAQLDKQAS
jgi:hypothetical protein